MSNKTVKFARGDRPLFDRFKIRQVIGTGNSIVYEVADEEHTI